MERDKTRSTRYTKPRLKQHDIDSRRVSSFQKKVWNFFAKEKRYLPWRQTRDPYKILVSEIMLQQTQVERVIPKYKAFMQAFPAVHDLASASRKDVLALWSGLGYNSRALRLQKAADIIVKNYGGRVPQEKTLLIDLPGIGPYTAGAIRAFAYDAPDIFLETNIRTVLLHEFFQGTKKKIDDRALLFIAELVLPEKDFRGWYSALMDYGSYLKGEGKSQNKNVKSYTKQSKFKGSIREARGNIVKLLLQKSMTAGEIMGRSGLEKAAIERALQTLVKEEMITKRGVKYIIRQT